MMRNTFYMALLLLLTMKSSSALATDKTDPQQVLANQWHVSLAVGYGYVDVPRAGKKPVKTYLLPSISYYGEKFYLENFTMGYSLYEGDIFMLDLQTKLNDDVIFFELDGFENLFASDLLGFTPNRGGAGPTASPIISIERSVSYLGGVNALWTTPAGDLSLGGFNDISNIHNGHEAHLRLTDTFRYQMFAWAFELGATYKSKETVSYYYELRPDEIGTIHTGYNARAGVNYHARALFDYPLSDHWSAIAVVEYNRLASNIADSPFLNDNEYWGGFVGVNYRF
ncbi:MipA/OmpV family protein [Pseudidiomarina sp. 1APP75-32.1]|uniref:MipA/OmpV family protein n=1 Tax=Pseudidiomarina terrestris TaxID=2820060 RepID=A0AAW7R4K5_9GAMM|nr:MipA/OmpV family protein [Pseudidiomarina sp. 1APP75-32.1]MDN7125686.1 MipA/OmpV family protein [Pseudidiomarina sp. 1APP75-32.1]